MNRIMFGIICGFVFGIIDVLIMLPMSFENKRKKWEALSSAFIDRFLLGFLIPIVAAVFPIHPALVGLIFGFLLSLPSAIITRAYAPILGMGIVGGVILGFITTIAV
jgi:hypothetical protein